MKVGDIMSTKLVTVTLDDNLGVVKEIFDNAKFHHLLVIEEEKLFGVVSDRDLFKAISPNIGTSVWTYRDLKTLEKRVHQIVTRNPITLRADADIYDALNIFNSNNISCIPIVDDEHYAIGIVTVHDIMLHFARMRNQAQP